MRRRFLALGVSTLCLALAPTLALGAQSNTAGAEASAANGATSDQLIAQSGGGSAEQSATNLQIIPVAVAPAVAPQVVPVNLNLPISVASTGEPGAVDQSNKAHADASAGNQAASSQTIVQSGGDAKKGDSGPSASQSATNLQVIPVAAAPAVAPQIVPVNANVPVSILSSGPSGDVDQSNRAYAEGSAGNTAASDQAILQGGSGSGSASQSATNAQLLPIALAPAIAPQVLPINANVPVSFLSDAPSGDVDQSNRARAEAWADNTAASYQAIVQGDPKKGDGSGSGWASQSATNVQFLPIAFAPAIAPQVLPINANVPVTVGNPLAVLPLPVDPLVAVADPVGTVTGLLPALPVNPFALLGDPLSTVTGAVGTVSGLLPLGAVTGLLPLGAVTGLLPLSAVTGLLPALPVGI